MDTKSRLLATSAIGLRRVDVRKALASGFPDPEEVHARVVSAADKRARRRSRNLQQVSAGGWWAPRISQGASR